MSDDIVERVAVAMRIAYARLNHDEPPIPFDKSRARDEWLCCARAAIEALREPTEAMSAALDDQLSLWVREVGSNEDVYYAAIDAALQPATDSEAK